jgi:HSP20 family molecular chaperone IbpA
MFDVPVQKVPEGKGIPLVWLERLTKFTEQVRHKAFEMFEESGRPHSHDVNRWLEAEKQLPSAPRYELLETKNEVDVCVAVPGFDVDEIGIVALRDSLLVRAASTSAAEKREGELLYAEFDDRTLFRRIKLPVEIDVASVSAKLDKGILSIAARKTAPDGETGCNQNCCTCRTVKATLC